MTNLTDNSSPRRATHHVNAATTPYPTRRSVRELREYVDAGRLGELNADKVQPPPAVIEQPAPEIWVNWRAVAAVCFFSALFLLFGIAIGAGLVSDAGTSMVPACTDAIADAGGICRGEPR